MVNEIDTDEVHGDADNPITQNPGAAWADPVHDAAGNMTTAPWPASLTTGITLTYDAWNRLVLAENGETDLAKYEYDGLNRRTIEVPIWNTTYYHHCFWNSSWQLLELRVTTTPNTQPASLSGYLHYVRSPRYIDALVFRERVSTGERFYYLGDANFNVTTLIDSDGDAREHYQYDPYGKVTVLNGGTPDSDGDEWTADPNNASDVHNQYLYTGRKLDFKTFFYYYRNRYYTAELARFTGRDPIGYWAGDPNLYRYVANEPTNSSDPFGTAGIYVKISPLQYHRNCKKVSGTFKTEEAAGRALERHKTRHAERMQDAGRVTFVIGFSDCYYVIECDELTASDKFWAQQDFMLLSPIAPLGKGAGVIKGGWNLLKRLFTRGGAKATAQTVGKTVLREGEVALAVVKDGKVIAQSSNTLLSHATFVERALGKLPEGARVVTFGKRAGEIIVLDSKTFHGGARPAPQVVIDAIRSVFE